MYTKEINYYGTRLNVEYSVLGSERFTLDPTETPEYTVTKITAYDSDVDLTDLLSEEKQQSIYEHLIELI